MERVRKQEMINLYNPVKQEDTEDLLTINTNPSVFEWLGTTSFITEGMIDEGFMGGSSDFYKDTYHKSLPGLVYKSIYGKDRYELDNENYSPTVLAQAGQFFLGLMNPMEILWLFSANRLFSQMNNL